MLQLFVISFVIAVAIMVLLFMFTNVPYIIILQIWNTKTDVEGIINPFLGVALYESKDGQLISNTLMMHEQVHLDQVERYGALKFCWLYVWYLVTKGYEKHPFEVEANKLAAKYGSAK